jgi:hypothetical protein
MKLPMSRSPKGYARRIWYNLKRRCGTDKNYLNIKVEFTQQEFYNWAIPALSKWFEENPDINLRPSIDRLYDDKNYTLDNIQILEFGENSRRRKFNKNSKAPEGFGWCSKCKQYVKRNLFSKAPSRESGINNYCNPCRQLMYNEKKFRDAPN